MRTSDAPLTKRERAFFVVHVVACALGLAALFGFCGCVTSDPTSCPDETCLPPVEACIGVDGCVAVEDPSCESGWRVVCCGEVSK